MIIKLLAKMRWPDQVTYYDLLHDISKVVFKDAMMKLETSKLGSSLQRIPIHVIS